MKIIVLLASFLLFAQTYDSPNINSSGGFGSPAPIATPRPTRPAPRPTIKPTVTPQPTYYSQPNTNSQQLSHYQPADTYSNYTRTVTTQSSQSCSIQVIKNGDPLVQTTNVRLQVTSDGGRLYEMDFGDGWSQQSLDGTFSHTYMQPGAYTVKAWASNTTNTMQWSGGPGCESTITVNLTTPAPTSAPAPTSTPIPITTAVAAAPVSTSSQACVINNITSPDNPPESTNVRYQVVSSGSQIYRMDYGDGFAENSADGIFSHTYMQPGTYTVRGYASPNASSVSSWHENPGCQRTIIVRSLRRASVSESVQATNQETTSEVQGPPRTGDGQRSIIGFLKFLIFQTRQLFSL